MIIPKKKIRNWYELKSIFLGEPDVIMHPNFADEIRSVKIYHKIKTKGR